MAARAQLSTEIRHLVPLAPVLIAADLATEPVSAVVSTDPRLPLSMLVLSQLHRLHLLLLQASHVFTATSRDITVETVLAEQPLLKIQLLFKIVGHSMVLPLATMGTATDRLLIQPQVHAPQ